MGTVLDFHVGFCYVLSHDTEAEKLQSADEDDHRNGGSPALNRIIEDQLSEYDDKQEQERASCHGGAEPGCDGQR